MTIYINTRCHTYIHPTATVSYSNSYKHPTVAMSYSYSIPTNYVLYHGSKLNLCVYIYIYIYIYICYM